MEADELRRSGGSNKISKKGGRRIKQLTAEEEARRREEVKEKLREKLELERRALQVVERLLDDSVAEDFLVDCAKFITAANYKDTIEERSIAKLCGFPVCQHKLDKIPTQQYKISTKTNRVYDITERKCFCSNFCYKASKEFELQISKTPLWLREHESPPEIRLLRRGDGGRSGQEVMLSEKRLHEEDIENPCEELLGSTKNSATVGHSGDDDDDDEEEPDFVSSVVSQQRKPRVHWGDLPTHKDDRKEGRREAERKPSREGREEETERSRGNVEREEESINTDQKETDLPGVPAVDEASSKLNRCRLSEAEPVLPETENKDQITSSSSLPITRVGMSKRGAAGLRLLMENRVAEPELDPVRLKLMAGLRGTLTEWCTEETRRFLYGVDPPLAPPLGNEEETLDEDDLEEGEVAMERRVREFYKLSPGEERNGTEDQDPVLPLVDSQAQHLIQKRITVEKLSSCLRNIVGPLHLTMSDVSTDLNNLVRTFRFTNTNILHKTPEWTLIAVVLLHLLSTVSPLVREALETSGSAEYLNTLTEELGVQQQDLLNLVQLFKSTTHRQP